MRKISVMASAAPGIVSLREIQQTARQAESLGFSGLTGNIIPRHMEFAVPIEAHPYDIRRAKQLLAEAGHAGGFDGGDFTPNPPYFGMAEAIVNNLAGVGIRVRLRTLERAAFLSAWSDRCRCIAQRSGRHLGHLKPRRLRGERRLGGGGGLGRPRRPTRATRHGRRTRR